MKLTSFDFNYVSFSVLLLARVHWPPTNWPPRVTTGAGTTRTPVTIPGVTSRRTTRKCRCYYRIVFLGSSWCPPRVPGTSTLWVSFGWILVSRDRTYKNTKTGHSCGLENAILTFLKVIYKVQEFVTGKKVDGKVCIQVNWPIRPALLSGFCSMMRLGAILFPPGWDANSSPVQIYTPNWREALRVSCLA